MTDADMTRKMEAEDLARGRELVQIVLREWNWLTWNEVLADQVDLSLALAAAGVDEVGDFAAVNGRIEVTGREDAKSVLKAIYGDLKKGLSITTELVSGYDVTLIGNLAVSNEQASSITSVPTFIYMAFDDDGKIHKMTIAALDLAPLAAALRAAAQNSAVRPS